MHRAVSVERAATFASLGRRSLRIALNVDNVFDKYYYNEAYTDADFNSNSFVRAVPGAPRSVVGTVSLRF